MRNNENNIHGIVLEYKVCKNYQIGGTEESHRKMVREYRVVSTYNFL